MKNYLVSFYVELPDDAPIKEVEDFMKFHLGEKSHLFPLTSSLQDCDLNDFEVLSVDVIVV